MPVEGEGDLWKEPEHIADELVPHAVVEVAERSGEDEDEGDLEEAMADGGAGEYPGDGGGGDDGGGDEEEALSLGDAEDRAVVLDPAHGQEFGDEGLDAIVGEVDLGPVFEGEIGGDEDGGGEERGDDGPRAVSGGDGIGWILGHGGSEATVAFQFAGGFDGVFGPRGDFEACLGDGLAGVDADAVGPVIDAIERFIDFDDHGAFGFD